MVGQIVERVLEWIFREQSVSDLGIDAQFEVVQDGESQGKLIAAQIKTGDSYLSERTSDAFVFRGELRHLRYWLSHSLPVIIVLVSDDGVAYWEHVTQGRVVPTAKAWKILVPFSQELGRSAAKLAQIARFRDLEVDSLEVAVARYRQALLTRVPEPLFFGPEARGLSPRDRDSLFVEPRLREPTRRIRESRASGDPPQYRSPWSWSESLPSRGQPGLLLLGEPGAGKSTTLSALARRRCHEDDLIPLFILLPRFAALAEALENAVEASEQLGHAGQDGGEDVVPCAAHPRNDTASPPPTAAAKDDASVVEVVETAGAGAQLMKYAESTAQELSGEAFQRLDRDRRFLWILDGLDEVLDPLVRGHVIRSIEALRSGDGEPRIMVVGSRPWPEPRLSPDFIRYELAPWNEDLVEELVRRYHEAIRPGVEGARRSELLLRALRTTPTLHELCQTPLILALVLSLGRAGEVPWPRPRLYHESVRLILDTDDGVLRCGVVSPRLSCDDKLLFLGRVAWDMLGRQQLTIAREELLRLAASWISETFGAEGPPSATDAEALVDELSQRGTILVPGDQGQLQFAIRAWWDYAAALEIRRRYTHDQLPSIFSASWNDPLWAESLLLTAGTIAGERAVVVFPLLLSVLRSRVSLDQWYMAEPLLYVMQALCYCPNLKHEPLATYAKAVTEFALTFDEDVCSCFVRALREAGPQWPGADEVRRYAPVIVALAVSDVDSRISVLLRYLPYTQWYTEHLQTLSFARRLGPWTDDEVRQLLAVRFRDRPDLDPIWQPALRIHLAVALIETGPALSSLSALETDLHAPAPEIRAYAALALLSLGEVHEGALGVLNATVQEHFWPGYVPSPMRDFLWETAEKCRGRLPEVTWQSVRAMLLSSASPQLRHSAEVPQQGASPSGEPSDPYESHIRSLLDIPLEEPLSREAVVTQISQARPGRTSLALNAAATAGFLPNDVWRSLGLELLRRYEDYYATRSDWRGNLVAWRDCEDHVLAVMEIATLLGERDTLNRLSDDERLDASTRGFVRRRLEFGERLDMLFQVNPAAPPGPNPEAAQPATPRK